MKIARAANHQETTHAVKDVDAKTSSIERPEYNKNQSTPLVHSTSDVWAVDCESTESWETQIQRQIFVQGDDQREKTKNWQKSQDFWQVFYVLWRLHQDFQQILVNVGR